MRYSKQPNSYSCGPTAILNAMKWAGIDARGRDHLSYLEFSCRTVDLQDIRSSPGTHNHDFDRVLRYVGKEVFHVRRQKKPTVNQMRRHLEKGQAVALAYHWNDGKQKGEHFCLIVGFKNGMFVCVNDEETQEGSATRLRRIETVKKWLKPFDDCPTAWFLTLESEN